MKPAVALIIAAILLVGTLLAMPRLTNVEFIDQPSISTTLPFKAGKWIGQRIMFCQNPDHGGTVLLDEADSSTKCPECGGDLNTLSPFETSVLPPDTRADKRQYLRDDGATLQAALVFSGRDRASIHRPEVCLVAEGSEIVNSRRHLIPLPGRSPLEIQLVDVQQSHRLPDGRVLSARTFFAYWFTGRGHETASHPVRMFWMAWDRIVLNRAYPWAYISIAGVYDQPGEIPLHRLDELVREIYPLLHAKRPAPAAGSD